MVHDFGPTQSDLINQRTLDELDKILPVLNGLVYMKKENRAAIIQDNKLLQTLFGIFTYQLPIELHENALYACLNLTLELSKQEKEVIVNEGLLYNIYAFCSDIFSLEFAVMKNEKGKFLVADYGIKLVHDQE